jgi:hypothetical protein
LKKLRELENHRDFEKYKMRFLSLTSLRNQYLVLYLGIDNHRFQDISRVTKLSEWGKKTAINRGSVENV